MLKRWIQRWLEFDVPITVRLYDERRLRQIVREELYAVLETGPKPKAVLPKDKPQGSTGAARRDKFSLPRKGV